MSMATDGEIIGKVLAGDVDAYEILIERYQRPLWSLVGYYIHNRTQIAEAVDAAFIKAYYALDCFELDKDFRVWLMQIARNEARQILRAALRESDAKQHYIERVAAQSALKEIDLAREQEMKGFLDDCVQHLPENQRALIEARYSGGKTISELAGQLQRSADAVKKTLSRVRVQLRECIERKAVGNA
jgi:RNA polymerase sigma-70 factor (ECF subfamily)